MNRRRRSALGFERIGVRGFRGPVALVHAATIVFLIVALVELDAVYVYAFFDGVMDLFDKAIAEYASLFLDGPGPAYPIM